MPEEEQGPKSQQAIVVTPRLLWAAGSAAGIIAGSLGTWITAGPFSISGTTEGGDGIWTLGLGILALVLIITEKSRPAVAAVAGAALAVGIIDASLVLRTDGNEIFSVSIGWGLVVLPLAALSLLAWAIVEIRERHASRKGIALVAATVVLVGTVGILAASGRFDDPNARAPAAAESAESSVAPESGTQAEQEQDDEVPAGQACDELGIDREGGKEGDCVNPGGLKVQVQNLGETVVLEDIEVSYEGYETTQALTDDLGEETKAEGVFVEVTLEVKNRSNQPIDFANSMFLLTANGTTNQPASVFVFRQDDEPLVSVEPLGPGLSRTGTVLFDVAESTATAIKTDGNVLMAQPGEDLTFGVPARRVAVMRTYEPSTTGSSSSAAASVKPAAARPEASSCRNEELEAERSAIEAAAGGPLDPGRTFYGSCGDVGYARGSIDGTPRILRKRSSGWERIEACAVPARMYRVWDVDDAC